MVNSESHEQIHHAQIAVTDGVLNSSKAPAMVDGAERMNRASRLSCPRRIAQDDHIGGGLGRGLNESFQDIDRHARSIDGDDQVPIGPGAGQGCFESAERPETRMKIVPTDVPKARVSGVRSEHDCRFCCRFNQTEHVHEKGLAQPRQQGLVTAHPGTSASRKDITRGMHPRMVAFEGLQYGYNWNTIDRFCFIPTNELAGLLFLGSQFSVGICVCLSSVATWKPQGVQHNVSD
jgi:hypothetical protein